MPPVLPWIPLLTQCTPWLCPAEEGTATPTSESTAPLIRQDVSTATGNLKRN